MTPTTTSSPHTFHAQLHLDNEDPTSRLSVDLSTIDRPDNHHSHRPMGALLEIEDADDMIAVTPARPEIEMIPPPPSPFALEDLRPSDLHPPEEDETS